MSGAPAPPVPPPQPPCCTPAAPPPPHTQWQEDDRRIAEVQYKRCCALQFSAEPEGALAAVQVGGACGAWAGHHAWDCTAPRRLLLLSLRPAARRAAPGLRTCLVCFTLPPSPAGRAGLPGQAARQPAGQAGGAGRGRRCGEDAGGCAACSAACLPALPARCVPLPFSCPLLLLLLLSLCAAATAGQQGRAADVVRHSPSSACASHALTHPGTTHPPHPHHMQRWRRWARCRRTWARRWRSSRWVRGPERGTCGGSACRGQGTITPAG